jgi:hypothetical protein
MGTTGALCFFVSGNFMLAPGANAIGDIVQ